MLDFFTESEKKGEEFKPTPTIGGFVAASTESNFDKFFESAVDNLKASTSGGMDIRSDINDFIKNQSAQQQFKEDLLAGIAEESTNTEYAGTYFEGLYDQVSQLYDNTLEDLYEEAAQVGTLLPIKAVDLPLCVKSHVKMTSNAIIRAKVAPTPVIKKQIERTWVVDPKTNKYYKYPQCLFTEEWKEIYEAGIGLPIKSDTVSLPIFNYDIIDELTDATVPEREKITIDIKIPKVILDDGTEVMLQHPMYVNLADGSWIGGVFKDYEYMKSDGTKGVLNDVVSGFTDFTTSTTTITSANGKVTGVVFEGKLSNEKNERQVTFDYSREDKEWKIDDGFRTDARFSLEKLMDYKTLARMDLYKRSYNDINELLSQEEDNKTFQFLDDMFQKYDGVEYDLLDFNPFVCHDSFDCNPTSLTTMSPAQWISEMLKFEIDRYLINILDEVKLEGLTFVIYGNPRYISLLNPNVEWKVTSGGSVGGIKLDYNYGVMTTNGMKIPVVSVMKLDAKKYDTLRFVAFPTNELTITFEKYRYANHIATAQNSAYRAPELPGGSQTYVVGTSRYKHICMQGIQADMGFDNAEFLKLKPKKGAGSVKP